MPVLRRLLVFSAFTLISCAGILAQSGTPTSADSSQPALPANQILAQSNAEAAAKHKNVLLVFSASWCGPCHLFEAFLHDPATGPIMDKNFVVARFDVGEHPGDKRHSNTPGAEALRASLDGADPGYPFLVIASPSGKVIVNSYRPIPGRKNSAESNIGYPATPAEIDWFMQMLRQSAAISAPEADAIRRWLQQRSHL
jgi:thiol-disulfide isomerase/thioredoxin